MATLPALGKPAVSDPRVLELREVQQVIANVRERLGMLDRFVLALSASTVQGQTSSAQALDALSAQLLAIEQTVTALGLAMAGLDAGGDDAQAAFLAAEVARLGKALADFDQDTQSAYLAAAAHELRNSIDDINKGVLA